MLAQYLLTSATLPQSNFFPSRGFQPNECTERPYEGLSSYRFSPRRFFPMRLARSVRWLLLALVVTVVALVPLSSQAGVFISVGFAPPILPVYVQPVCPQPGLMWTPGYLSLIHI